MTEVKVVLASAVTALALYQVLLMAIGYGKLRPGFLSPRPATLAHRALGDTIVPVTVLVAVICISFYGLELGEDAAHVIAGSALLAVLAAKVAVVRRGGERASRLLPALGGCLLVLFLLTWLTSAGSFLVEG